MKYIVCVVIFAQGFLWAASRSLVSGGFVPRKTVTESLQRSDAFAGVVFPRVFPNSLRPVFPDSVARVLRDAAVYTLFDSTIHLLPAPAGRTSGAPALASGSLRQLVHGGDFSAGNANTARVDSVDNRSFLEDVISGRNKDSLVYNVSKGEVKIYRDGEVNYQTMKLKADFIQMDMNTKLIHANGIPTDTVPTRPEFTERGATYTMDTINYNIDTRKAKIKGVFTKEGEGYLHGMAIKKMPDNTTFIKDGKYTTCDCAHPHFYIELPKAKMLPKKKIVTGAAYLVMEDVPIYFLGLPFGFFPLMGDRNSGFIIPEVGEVVAKGFFLRNGGYYFAFNDYVDLTVLGGIYTKGSWEGAVSSRYTKRYTYSGNLQLNFSKDILGDKGSTDYVNGNNFRVTWTHQQDSKFRPNSTFSASVNFSTSGYNKYGAQNLSDYLNTQTNSSIAYSKQWAGRPFSLSTNMQHSQNSQDSTISLSFPNVVFNVSRIYPFRRREVVGKQRWYEKIGLTYTGTLSNNVLVKQKELFSEQTIKNMRNGVNHQIPISTSFNILKYLNISPNANYNERWYFRKIEKQWNPDKNQVEVTDTTNGFYRVYDYRFSMSASTRIYGSFTFGDKSLIRAIRHVMTPSISFNYAPDFSKSHYGYYKPIQVDSTGRVGYYSPFEQGMYGVPGRGQSASLSFSLGNTVEMKVRSKKDTTGVKKVKLLDNLSISSSYNFLADSMNLAPFGINGRVTIKSFGINFNATLDPYQINAAGQRINRFAIKDGTLARLTNLSFSFGYTFNNSTFNGGQSVMNDINSNNPPPPEYTDFFNTTEKAVDPNLMRQLMSSKYYDFSIPWNIGFNYNFNLSKPGLTRRIVQTLGFNGSITLTEKWGFSFNGGYDFVQRKLTPGTFAVTRDLHCWQMSFTWVPLGFRQSWSFNIGVKSAILRDLKYDKRSSFYDNYYD